MDILFQKSKQKQQLVKNKQKRYLFNDIDWSQKLIIVKGYRGTGKTTLILQYLSTSSEKGVYVSLDDIYFEKNRLVDTVKTMYDKGIRLFLLDEVHKYSFWSKDLKQIYDDYHDIQIVATGSSILDISKGSADLSRRASTYTLSGLSFREYLNFKRNIDLRQLSLNDVIENHHQLSADMLDLIHFEKDFKNYLNFGYYPFFLEGEKSYFNKLEDTLNLVIDTDIAPVEELQYQTIRTMKKLLYIISQSVPFKPNINKLAEKMESTRNTILKLLDIMQQAEILNLLKTNTKGVSYLQKPEKIYLENSNFIYLFSAEKSNIGNIRETFFFNQLSVKNEVNTPKYGDFLIDNKYIFEVGGASKGFEQIKGVPNAYLALDIKNGNDNRIPLWMFGLLY